MWMTKLWRLLLLGSVFCVFMHAVEWRLKAPFTLENSRCSHSRYIWIWHESGSKQIYFPSVTWHSVVFSVDLWCEYLCENNMCSEILTSFFFALFSWRYVVDYLNLFDILNCICLLDTTWTHRHCFKSTLGTSGANLMYHLPLIAEYRDFTLVCALRGLLDLNSLSWCWNSILGLNHSVFIG